VYHLRASRYRRSLWQPFVRSLGGWLAQIETPNTRLILVGPSAGYCLRDEFFQRFEEVVLCEPDPLALWLLSSRLERLGIRHVVRRADDLLIAPLLHGELGLGGLLEQEPHSALAFCNVLGQVRFLLSESDFERWLGAFRERIAPRLAGRAWFSFHDRVSGELAPRLEAPCLSPRALDDGELLARFYATAPERARPFELTDHHTARIFPRELPRAYFAWQLAPARHYLVEGVAGLQRI
jgi:hypothetical protein